MPYIIYHKTHGATALIDAPVHTAPPQDGYVYIPCEAGADVNDAGRWEREAAEMGDRYAPTVEAAREKKRVELMYTRDALILEGFPYGGYVFPLSADVQLPLTQAFMGAQAFPGPHYVWKDITGIYRPIGDAGAFMGFCLAAMAHGQGLFAREAMLQEIVEAIEDIDQIAAVKWGMDVTPYLAVLGG